MIRLGDQVEVVPVESASICSEYYVGLYAGMNGKVVGIHGDSYEVEFEHTSKSLRQVGIFYRHELKRKGGESE